MSASGIATGAGVLSSPTRLYLAQIVVIMALCQVLGLAIRRWNQPRVIAEVLGGILLGPTFLGQIPGFTNALFPASSITPLKNTATLGLVLFLFIVGLELDPNLLRGSIKRSAAVSFSGQFSAWMLSLIVSNLMWTHLGDLGNDKTSFTLFVGISMAVTAFPVLSRILTEQRLLGTRVGVAVISAAAFDDVVAWCMLALVISIVNAGAPSDAAYVFLLLAAYALIMLFIGRPILAKVIPKLLNRGEITHSATFVCLLVALFSGWVTDIIGIDAIFGGFIAGLAMPRVHNLPIQIVERIEDVISIVLLPLYFAVSGLKTDFTALNNGRAWGFVVLVITLSVLGKVVGCGTAARLVGMSKRESLAMGFLMDTRGLVEIIILNIGLDAGVINQEVFAILILMAVFTTFLTSPVVAAVYPSKYHTFDDDKASISASEALEGPMALPPPSAALALSPSEMLSFAERRLRLLVCVPDLKALTTIVKVVRLISHPGSNMARASLGAGTESDVTALLRKSKEAAAPVAGGDDGDAESGAGYTSPAAATAQDDSTASAVHAVRIMEVSDTYASDMMSINTAKTLKNDELAGLLQTFGQMNSVSVQTHLALGSESAHIADWIIEITEGKQRNTILVPWAPESTSTEEQQQGANKGVGTMAGEEGLKLVSQVLEGAAHRQVGNVVVMLDRGLRLGQNRILVPYMGGADDEEALMLALALLQPGTELLIFRRRAESSGNRPAVLASVAANLRASGKHLNGHFTSGSADAGALAGNANGMNGTGCLASGGGGGPSAAEAAALQQGNAHPMTLGSTRLMSRFDDPSTAANGAGAARAGNASGGGGRSGTGDYDLAERGNDGPHYQPNGNAPTPSNGAITPSAALHSANIASGNVPSPRPSGYANGGGGFEQQQQPQIAAQQKLLEAVSKLPHVRVIDVFMPPGSDAEQALLSAMPSELKSFGVRRHTLVVCGRSDVSLPPASRGGSVVPSAAAAAAAAAAANAAAGMGPHHTVTGGAIHRQQSEDEAANEANVQRTWGHVFRSISKTTGAALFEGFSSASHASQPRIKVLGRTGASIHIAFPDVSVMVVHSFPATESPST